VKACECEGKTFASRRADNSAKKFSGVTRSAVAGSEGNYLEFLAARDLKSRREGEG
jgi:hypothetical protein